MTYALRDYLSDALAFRNCDRYLDKLGATPVLQNNALLVRFACCAVDCEFRENCAIAAIAIHLSFRRFDRDRNLPTDRRTRSPLSAARARPDRDRLGERKGIRGFHTILVHH